MMAVDSGGEGMYVEQDNEGRWWIYNISFPGGSCGPYWTETAAKSDMAGMKRFYRNEDDPTFFHGEGKLS